MQPVWRSVDVLDVAQVPTRLDEAPFPLHAAKRHMDLSVR